MKTIITLLLAALFVLSCGTSSAERKPSRPRNFIPDTEIQEFTTARTARDIVELARPAWLRQSRGMTLQIYINGILMGAEDQLDNVSTQVVKEMSFFFSYRSNYLVRY